jgi:hypothetical protein
MPGVRTSQAERRFVAFARLWKVGTALSADWRRPSRSRVRIGGFEGGVNGCRDSNGWDGGGTFLCLGWVFGGVEGELWEFGCVLRPDKAGPLDSPFDSAQGRLGRLSPHGLFARYPA